MTIMTAAEALSQSQHPGTRFVDTRPEAAWRAETIPGAVCLNVYDYFIPASTEEGIRGMVAGGCAAFAALGLDRADRVVFFEERTGMISPRGLWFHQLCGLTGGAILDGGIADWIAAGGPTAPGTGTPAAVTQGDPAAAGSFCRALVASTADLRAGDRHLLDARRPAEWSGDYVHACCARAGRIAGADLLFFEDLLQDGRYRAPDEIARIAAAAGFAPGEAIAAYCHRGARAATALYGLQLAGFDRVAVFTGSWHEWAGDPSLPIVPGSGATVHG